MQAANAVVALTSVTVYPAVGITAIRTLIDSRSHSARNTRERRTTPLGLSAILIVAVAALYYAGFYATPPFEDISRFSSVFFSSMLPIQIGLEKRSMRGYITATIFFLVLIGCLAATVIVRLKL